MIIDIHVALISQKYSQITCIKRTPSGNALVSAKYRVFSYIEVLFSVNKGTDKFWDFFYCPLNKGCPLNTGLTVVAKQLMSCVMISIILLSTRIEIHDCIYYFVDRNQ